MNSRYDTIVIGAGQAGLSIGFFLAKEHREFVLLEANARIGDSWRNRWDSLRLFTPARFDGLAGMPFPAPSHTFPTKDEMADYLESYAARFHLPVELGVRVDRLYREDGRFIVMSGDRRLESDNVVVAMSSFQKPHVPPFAPQLAPGIVQFHSMDYRNPSQLRPGGVLIVGSGNSGAEIAMDVAHSHPTWMSGRDTGHIPFRIDGIASQIASPLFFRFVAHRVLTTHTPIGRKARAQLVHHGDMLIRVKPKDLTAAGVQRVPKIVGVRDGLPLLEDGRVLDVTNVIWCTGFDPSFSWIDLPVFHDGEPTQERGVVASTPGLYFVGLKFLYAVSSTQIHGVERDARYVVERIAERSKPSSPGMTQRRAPAGDAGLSVGD